MELTKETAKNILTEYMTAIGYRKTPERYAVLDAVWTIEGPFRLLTIHRQMEENYKFRVCRATIYNNVKLLMDAGLVVRSGSSKPRTFERAFN